MAFTAEEIAYLQSQPLCRIASATPDGEPDVVPTGYTFDGEVFWLGGRDPVRTRRFANVRAGNDRVAIVVDDLVSTSPWAPRFLRLYGTAELTEQDGAPVMKVTPTISWSWNLEGHPIGPDLAPARRTVHRG